MKNRCRDRSTGCETWVTGGLQLNFERDEADGHVLAFQIRGALPRRWAVRPGFVASVTKEIPGGAEWVNGRLILRPTVEVGGQPGIQEHAYRRRGTCPGCGYVLLEYQGAG